jgi:hypothetical protein
MRDEYHAMQERLDAAETERARLMVWLRDISDFDPRDLLTGYETVRRAKSALKEAGDE